MSLEQGSAGRIGLQVLQTLGTIALAVYATPAAAYAATVGHALFWALYDTQTAKDAVTEQPSIADLKIQTSSLGIVIPQLFGQQRLAGNVFWATDKVEHQSRTEKSAKGGGPKQVTIDKTYTVSWAIGLADTRMTGPIVAIRRIWRDTTLIMDITQSGDGGIGTFTISHPGEDYEVGDYGGIGGGNNDAAYEITAVDSNGGVTAMIITVPGSGYSITTNPENWNHLHRNLAFDHGNNAGIDITGVIGNVLASNWVLYTGTADQGPDPTIESFEGMGNVPGFHYRAYVVITDDDLGSSGRTFQYTFELSQYDGGAPLDSVVTKLCAVAGILDQVNLSELPSGAVNLAIVSVEALRVPMQQLADVFRFYAVESQAILAFRQRGSGGVVATIPASAMDAAEYPATTLTTRAIRRASLELPTDLSLTYVDPQQNYQTNTQRAQRYLAVGAIANARVQSTSLALDSARAKQTVQELLQDAWLQRTPVSLTLPSTYAYLDPGDRVIAETPGLTYALVLLSTSYGSPGMLEVEAVSDTAWVVDAPGALPGVHPVDQPIVYVPASTIVSLLNLPALTSSDMAPRYHAAYRGALDWPGAVLYRSTDGEATYHLVDGTDLPAWTGLVDTPMADADPHVLDLTTEVTVVLEQGTLTSVSDAALYGGANLAVLGAEVFAFGVAELIAEQTYTLSRLLRGRRGTELATGTHGSGERFVLLDTAVRTVTMLLADRGIERPYKPVTLGQDLADAEPTLFTPMAANLNPWSVAQPTAERVGTDWVLSWRYRSRYAGDWVDGHGIGWDADANGFKLVIWTDGSFTTPARTILTDGGNPLDPEALKEYVYDATLQTTDFGSPQTTLYFSIYALTYQGISLAEQLTRP